MNKHQVTDQLTNAELEVLYFLGEEHRVSPNYVEEHTTVSSQHAGNILRDLAGHGVTTKLTHGLYDLNTPTEITAGTPVAEAARAFLLDEFDTNELEPEDILADELQDNEHDEEESTPDHDVEDFTTVPSSVEDAIQHFRLNWNPGRGYDDKKERREYGCAALKVLYHAGSAQRGDFKRALWPEYSLDTQTKPRHWWENMIRPCLETAADENLINIPEDQHGVYEWTGSE